MKKKILFSFLIIMSIVLILPGCNQINNNSKENKKNTSNEFIGKWNTISAINSKTGDETRNLTDVFGSSYNEFGSYLELKEDGTFINSIIPITDGSKSNIGKYTIKKDYMKQGDAYVILSYSDGGEEELQRVYLDDNNTPYLVLDSFVNDYQLYLKK